MRRTTLSRLRLRVSPLDRRRGHLIAGALVLPCALGRAGVAQRKREGDGATPVGRFPLLALRFRADRLPRPRTFLSAKPIRRDDGWCDAPADRRYNRPVRLPYPASCERLWREDGLYDLVLDMAYNRGPIRPGRGSAVFFHLARADLSPTEGCVAIAPEAMRRLLARLGPRTRVEILR